MSKIAGYRLEWKKGVYMVMTVEEYARELKKASARTHALYTDPQPGCDPKVYIYRGATWVKINSAAITATMIALYLGPLIWEPIEQYLDRTTRKVPSKLH